MGNLIVQGPRALSRGGPVDLTATTGTAPTSTQAAASGAEPPAAGAAPVETASAEGADPAAGEAVFKKCAACHSVDKGGKAKTGPNLWGVVNGPVAHAADFKYSDAMQSHGGEWTPEALDAYLEKPKDAVPGNKMAFAGLKKAGDRHNVIAYLAAQSDAPIAPDALAFAAGAAAVAGAAETEAPEAEEAEIMQIAYTDPAEPSEDEIAEIAERIAELEQSIPAMDYQRARYAPIHFPPQVQQASNGECLTCHQEIIDHEVREVSPAGVQANEALAWYQTLDTYVPKEGTGQSDFHWRHLESPLAKQVMNLQCNFCHKGNDPREEAVQILPGRAAFTDDPAHPEFTNRKMVNPSETCLRCHGQMPNPTEIMGLGGPWPEIRADMEDQTSDDPTLANGCLSCHQDLYRTNRHNVTYLKAAGIENLAQAGSDTCYGCHGGRAWYRISYPYPRHPWPDMDTETPDWAKDRPTESDPEYQRAAAPANP